VLQKVGVTARDQGDAARAIALLEESLVRARREGNKLESAWALHGLGETALLQGEDTRALVLEQASAALFRELDAKGGLGWALHNQGYLAQHRGDYAQARAFHAESLGLFREMGQTWGIAACLAGLAGVYGGQGALEQAAQLFGAALALHEAVHEGPYPAQRREIERNMAAAGARLNAATWDAAWAEGRAMTLEQAIAYALEDDPTAD
jgi:tetratricopeptide (TPR) repeat protein